MISDIAGFIITVAPVLALLVWRERVDHRERAAWLVRADVHANARRALEGESLLAIDVRSRSVWRHGEIRLSTPSGYESLIGGVSRAVFEHMPAGYDVVIYCGGGS